MNRVGLVCGVLVLGVLLVAQAWAQDLGADHPAGLVGTWLVRTANVFAQVDLRADGTFTRTTKGLGDDGTFEGTWRADGKRLTLQDRGSAEVQTLNYELAGNQLTVTDDEGSGFRMERQATVEAPPAGGAQAAATPATCEIPGGLTGTWVRQDAQPAVTYEFRPDGTYTMTVKSALADAKGTGKYTTAPDGTLSTTPDSGMGARKYQYRLTDPNTLELIDPAGLPMRFGRQGVANQVAQQPAAQPGQGVPVVPGALPAGGNLRLPFPLPKTPGGHIVYMQWVPMQAAAAGLQASFPLPKLFVMNADGSQKTPLVPVNDFTSYKDPRWSPDYDRLAFVSDFLNARSACMEDVFVMPAAGGFAVRMTGNELKGPAPEGYGIVTGLVEDNTRADFAAATSPTEINVTAQGSDGTIFHPGQKVDVEIVNRDNEKLRDGQVHRFILPRVMAGQNVWLKLWKTKENGSLHLIQVKPNQVNDVGAVALSGVTLKAAYPSLSRNPRYIVGMGGMEWIEFRTNRLEMGLAIHSEGGYTPNFRNEREGAANVCLWDMNAGGVPVAMFEATKALGEGAKDPAVSPDGSLIAVGWGRTLCENLALIRTEDLLANRPNPRVLVPGAYNLPSDMNMWQGSMVGCGSPAWSSDGRMIAFAYGRSWTDYNTAQIAVVNADGTGLRQLTNVGINQIACQPCFSPDGQSVAFTVLTGKFGPMKMEHIIAMQFTSDIWVVNLDGTGLRQITNDGASSAPAWGL
jgi:hypothetical protein